ncbi:MAG: preprotein translocase subunit YajC [Bacteroidales bacterium]|nr:preprotein translocase subunit YajC [Bacteroidales bacterium]
MELLNVLLMAPPKEGQSPYGNFIFLALLIFVFYFFMIRPQSKRQKELKNFRESLTKGDKIITTGGIYGKIAEIHETTVIIEVEEKIRLKVDKSAIVRDPADMAQTK